MASVTGRGASTSTFSAFNGGLTATKTAKNAYAIQIKGSFYGAPRLQLYDLAVDPNAFLGLGVDMSGASYEFSNYFPRTGGYGRWSVGSWAGDFGSGQYVSGYNEKLFITESAAQFNVALTVSGNISATNLSGTNTGNVTIGTANGLSLSGQQISLGLASAGVTGALSGTDWTTFNNKQNALTNPVTGTGTTNYLPKFTGSTTIGNSNIISDGSGKFSLGTAATHGNATFEQTTGESGIVVNSSIAESPTIYLRDAGGAGYSTILANNNLYLNASRILVGTTTDNGARLQVEGTASFNFANNSSGITFSRQTIGQLGSIINSGSEILYQGTGSVFINADSDSNGTGANREVSLGNRGVAYMTIASTGNVGIGTSTTQSQLHLSSTAPIMSFTDTNSFSDPLDRFMIRAGSNQGNIQWYDNSSATTLSIMTFLSSGAATFGSSVSIGGADQEYQLDVKRTSTGDATFDTVANFYKASTHNTGLLLRLKNTIVDLAANNITGGGGPSAGMSFSVSSGGTISPALTIASTGAATFSSSVTATSFFESSDSSLKTLVEDNYQAKGIDSVVAKLYIKNGKEELGYYAQDLQGVLPSAVSKGSDGLLNLSYREVHTAKIACLEEKIKQLENELGRISK